MAATTLKVETEAETCCICGSGGELVSPEEYDAGAAPMQVPMRTMLMHLNNNKVVPEGRLCEGCVSRAVDAYEFSSALSARGAPPLSDKIRALRRRLHELTQKIDVFIVVGGPGGAAPAYSEDDIIMVDRDALAAAARADDADREAARNARGDHVYQCSVCPESFQRLCELSAHGAAHPAAARHSCWTCGAQFASRAALAEHAAAHAAPRAAHCWLCDTDFSCQAELRRHEAACAARCPACGALQASRGELAAHAAAQHGRAAAAPHVCPACFQTFPRPDLLSAHQLTHRQAKQFVCGYGSCVLRFASRALLLAHLRAQHAADLAPPPAAAAPPATADAPHACTVCDRSFASSAALKRHMHAHQRALNQTKQEPQEATEGELEETAMEVEGEVTEYVLGGDGGEGEGEGEGEVEYLEVETLEEAEYVLQEE